MPHMSFLAVSAPNRYPQSWRLPLPDQLRDGAAALCEEPHAAV